MRKLILLMLLLPTSAAAANDEHAACVSMVADAYRGLKVMRGEETDDRRFMFYAVKNDRLDAGLSLAVHDARDAATEAAHRYIDALSEVCDAIRTP